MMTGGETEAGRALALANPPQAPEVLDIEACHLLPRLSFQRTVSTNKAPGVDCGSGAKQGDLVFHSGFLVSLLTAGRPGIQVT